MIEIVPPVAQRSYLDEHARFKDSPISAEASVTHQETSVGPTSLSAMRQPLNITCMKAHRYDWARDCRCPGLSLGLLEGRFRRSSGGFGHVGSLQKLARTQNLFALNDHHLTRFETLQYLGVERVR
jgi:hypothetical protein